MHFLFCFFNFLYLSDSSFFFQTNWFSSFLYFLLQKDIYCKNLFYNICSWNKEKCVENNKSLNKNAFQTEKISKKVTTDSNALSSFFFFLNFLYLHGSYFFPQINWLSFSFVFCVLERHTL